MSERIIDTVLFAASGERSLVPGRLGTSSVARLDGAPVSARNPEVRTVSAFFPCYNDALAIGTMVRSVRRVLAEAVDDFEIIVIDDGSTDGSVDVLQALTVGDPRAAPRRPRAQPRLRRRPRCRASPPPRASGSSTPTATPSTTPASSGRCIDAVAPDTDIVQGYKLGRGDPWYRKAIGRTYHHTVRVLFRLARARHRLRLPPDPRGRCSTASS